MNQRQFKIYQKIVDEYYLNDVTLTEVAGQDTIRIKAGMNEFVVFPDGDIVRTGPKIICDNCEYTFTPLTR